VARLSENSDGTGWNWTFPPGDHSTIGADLHNKISRVEVINQSSSNLQTLIDNAVSAGNRTLTLSANAIYTCAATLRLHNLTNFTLEGNGARLFFQDSYANAVSLYRSKNVKVKNLSIDYTTLPFTQGVVKSVNSGNGTSDIQVDPGWSDDPALFNANPEVNGLNRWTRSTGRMRTDVGKLFVGAASRPESGVLRVPATLAVNDVVTLHTPWRGVAFWMEGSEACVAEKVTVYTSTGVTVEGNTLVGTHVLDPGSLGVL
jgi:hypothetical protein